MFIENSSQEVLAPSIICQTSQAYNSRNSCWPKILTRISLKTGRSKIKWLGCLLFFSTGSMIVTSDYVWVSPRFLVWRQDLSGGGWPQKLEILPSQKPRQGQDLWADWTSKSWTNLRVRLKSRWYHFTWLNFKALLAFLVSPKICQA